MKRELLDSPKLITFSNLSLFMEYLLQHIFIYINMTIPALNRRNSFTLGNFN